MIFHKIKTWYTIDLPSNMKDFSTKERSSSLSVKAAFDRRRRMRRMEWDETKTGPKLDNLKVKARAEGCASNARFSLLSNHFKVSTTSYHSGRYSWSTKTGPTSIDSSELGTSCCCLSMTGYEALSTLQAHPLSTVPLTHHQLSWQYSCSYGHLYRHRRHLYIVVSMESRHLDL